jgi:DNA integrity scanning protein DisA with diadenylate cyclase activity
VETVARIDGGIVLDSESNLLAFGAILRHPDLTDVYPEAIEGGRTTAAISASRFGNVLKISEDGQISFFRNGKCVWDL